MTIRTRLALPSVVLLAGALVSACGGSGAPTDASDKRFCQAQMSILDELVPDMSDLSDLENVEMPSNDDMADAMHAWADRIEEVGTPEGIPEDARAGFETTVEQARDITAADFAKADEDPGFDPFGGDLSGEAKDQAEAFGDYVNDKCGDPFGGDELPELPELPEAPESTE